MTLTHLPTSGVAGVGTLRAPAHGPAMPMSSTQGTLALEFDSTPSLPAAPELALVTGGRAELDAFAARFAQAVVEVIGGDRGVHQLLRWTTERVYEDLTRRTSMLSHTTPGDHRVRRLRAQVRSVHLFCPTAHAAELSVHVRHGHRSRAIAARIEIVEGRWRCTALQFG
ncbi:MAG: Rv3235 family protein [Actinomycetota bacterium]|nr:Rv3235 family protein [Actinomycetota bacterium]